MITTDPLEAGIFKENKMDTPEIVGNWYHLKGKVKQKFSNITANNLIFSEGRKYGRNLIKRIKVRKNIFINVPKIVALLLLLFFFSCMGRENTNYYIMQNKTDTIEVNKARNKDTLSNTKKAEGVNENGQNNKTKNEGSSTQTEKVNPKKNQDALIMPGKADHTKKKEAIQQATKYDSTHDIEREKSNPFNPPQLKAPKE